MMNESESRSNEYLRPPLWHGKIAFGKVALRLTLQKSDASQKNVSRLRQASLFELDEPFEQKSAIIRCRLLVLGLYLSFLACLTGLWLTGNSSSGLVQKLPTTIVNFIAAHSVVVLLVPLLLLLGCYFLLRLMTYDILAWPERFLDERQQIVRDHAHQNAYKIVKVACLLIPLYLCMHAVFWTAQIPAPASPQALTLERSSESFIDVATNMPLQSVQGLHWLSQQVTTLHGVKSPQGYLIVEENIPVYSINSTNIMASPPFAPIPVTQGQTWPNDPASMLLYYGTLLLGLLLMAIALPMSIVAWKERL